MGKKNAHPEYEPIGVESPYSPPQAIINPDPSLGWIRRIFPLLGAHRMLVLFGGIIAIISLVSQVAIPYVGSLAIDAAADGDRNDLNRALWLLGGLVVLRTTTVIFYRSAFFKIAFNVDYSLRCLLFERLSLLSFSFYDKTPSGELISRANSDIRSIQIFFAFVPIGLTSMAIFFFALFIMFSISVWLTLVAVSSLPFVYYLGNKFRDKVFPLSWITQGRMAEMATIVDENINGIRIVKAFASERQQVKSLAKSARKLQWSSVETIETRAAYNPLIEGFARLGLLAVLCFGGWLAIEGSVSIGSLFAFSAYVILLLAPFRVVGFLILQARRSATAAERVYQVLDVPIETRDHPDSVDVPSVSGKISFENVEFSYDQDGYKKSVLKNLNFEIQPGETVAVVGATGTGKSSIAKLIMRFYELDEGQIRIDDKNINDFTLRSLRHHVGLAFDEPVLFSTSIAENIAYGNPNADMDSIVKAAKAAQAHNFVENLRYGYDTIVGERGYDLSGGQRQRIALARAFLDKPPIIVLDDATSAIDVKTEEKILDELKKLTSTTLLIAHRLSEIVLSDYVLLIDNGTLANSGTHTELLKTSQRYREVLTEYEIKKATDEADEHAKTESGADK